MLNMMLPAQFKTLEHRCSAVRQDVRSGKGAGVQRRAPMISHTLRNIVLAGARASAGIATHAGTAVARTSHDGSWSVLIITESGACDRAYRYGVQISNGYVLGGDGSANLQGRVANNGAVRVSVSAGDQRATRSGRLSRDRGGGGGGGPRPTRPRSRRW